MRTTLGRLAGRGVMLVMLTVACGDPAGPDAGPADSHGYEFTELDTEDYIVQFAFQTDGTVQSSRGARPSVVACEGSTTRESLPPGA